MFEGKNDEEGLFFDEQNDEDRDPSDKDDVSLIADEEIDENPGL